MTAPLAPSVMQILERRRQHSNRGLGPFHQQELTPSGITVDREMVTLIHLLNERGLTTQYSCQGHPDMMDQSGELNNIYYQASIVFSSQESATNFIYITTQLCGSRWSDVRGATMHASMIKLESGQYSDSGNIVWDDYGARAMVTFDPQDLALITEAWISVRQTSCGHYLEVELPDGSDTLSVSI